MRPVDGPTAAAGSAAARAASGTAPAMKPAEVARLRRAVQEFEAIFLEHMLKTARQTPGKGLFPSGAGAEVYQGMADQELARAVAAGGGLGLSNLLLRHLLKTESGKSSSSSDPLPMNRGATTSPPRGPR